MFRLPLNIGAQPCSEQLQLLMSVLGETGVFSLFRRHYGWGVGGNHRRTFCVAKNNLPMLPICQQNHPSFETIQAAKAVLTPVVAAWFDSRVLEYIRRHHRLPHAVLASGSVSP